MNLEAQHQMRALDENWLTILSKMASALLLVDGELHVVAIRQGAESALDMQAELKDGFLAELRLQFEEAARLHEPVARYGVALPSRTGYVDLRIVSLPTGQRHERFAVLIQDATARVNMENENQRLAHQMLVADKLGSVGLLAAGVAHEVNNPLAYVMGNVEYLMLREPLSESARNSLVDIDKGLHEIASIVGDLKGFSYNATFAYRQSVDLVEIVKRACRLVSAEIRQHSLFEITLPPSPVYIRCQADRVQQVIVNLLINASHALPQRNTEENLISLGVELKGTTVDLSVTDNGLGMSVETQKKVFDLFFTTKPAGKGTGLGLSIAYNIARDHNGSLFVQSRLGQGSTFVFSLPRAAEPTGDLRVLVVDDEERALALYAKALANFHVTTASSVGSALSLMSNEYDAVLCDVRLPDGSGFDLYEQAPPATQCRFIFFTALPPETPELRERPEGITILHKPLNIRQIEQELYDVAGKKRA